MSLCFDSLAWFASLLPVSRITTKTGRVDAALQAVAETSPGRTGARPRFNSSITGKSWLHLCTHAASWVSFKKSEQKT